MNELSPKLVKALDLAKQRGLDGLIIYSEGPCVMAHPSYVYYFSGFKPIGVNSAIIASTSGDVTLLVEPEWESVRASKKSGIRNVRGTGNFAQELPNVLRALKIKLAGAMGMKQMTSDVYDSIQKTVEIMPAEDIIEEVARTKSRHEIDVARQAAYITDLGTKALLDQARIGMREIELTAEIGFAMRAAGAEDNFILLSSGKHSYEMHPSLDKRLEKGDIIIAEITPCVEGQFIQFCATLFLGSRPGTVLTEKYGILVKALEDSLKVIKPGVQASAMAVAMNKVIGGAGYEKYCFPPYMRTRGHGLGAGSISPGHSIDYETKKNFEKDQVVVVHPNQYIPETGYLACGEAILITENGIERLSKMESKLYTKEV